jgi:hypothetical protein
MKRIKWGFGIILVLVVLLIVFSIFYDKKEFNKNDTLQDKISSNSDIESNFREALENQFPEFKNFENQSSFAGKAVKGINYEGDQYYAYMVLGSGLPIAQATCFRVDRMGRAFQIGVFPDPLDSYAGYSDINPINCKGIK